MNDWSRAYARRLIVTDVMALIWVVFGVQLAWLGFDSNLIASHADTTISYTVISLVIMAIWLGALSLYGTRSSRVAGIGSAEYRSIADASARVFGLVAIVAFLLHVELARGYILIAFPVGIVVLMLSRWLWRQWLVIQRAQGRFAARVILVGSRPSVQHLARQLGRHPEAGYLVVGVCLPDGAGEESGSSRVRVWNSFDALAEAMLETNADTVIITSSDELPPDRVRELSWTLEPGRQHLVVAPSLTDIAGPRIHTRPVQGLPLIHVEMPIYEGRKLFLKRLFDIVASALIIVVASPALVVLALVVGLGSKGGVFFRQERLGHRAIPFNMLKFRTMVADAESQLQELSDLDRAEGNSILFKMKDDPRVTPAGRILRRYSADELPQLFNVLRGSMSLVGPRPSLQREVDLYEEHVHRRFLVKPGMTGLWQVSGRSNLSWEDSVRLDLFYVENWSITGDLVILWKTFKAVFAKQGAF